MQDTRPVRGGERNDGGIEFCGSVPLGVDASAGSCEPCWKCCLLPERYNTSAATNAAGAILSGACTQRCGCNVGRACRRDSDCAAGLFCMDRGQLEVPVCKRCTECTQPGCAPKCPGGPVPALLGPPPRNATSHDPALRDAAVFLSMALEPWRGTSSDRTQVQAEELRLLLHNETRLLSAVLDAAAAPYNATVSYTLTTEQYSDTFVENALSRIFGGDSPANASSAPLRDVAALLLHGSRALLCPAIPEADGSGARVAAGAAPPPLPQRTGPGCPCNASLGAATLRCPPGFVCSRAAHLALSFDVLADRTWAQLGGMCVPCTAGQLCLEGAHLSTDVGLWVPDCPVGHYCPTPGAAIKCPAGFFCPARTLVPITCSYIRQEDGLNVFWRLWKEREPLRGNYCPEGSQRPNTPCGLVRCPEGAAAPDGRPLAGIIFAAVDVAVLILYGLMLLGKNLVAQFLRGWNLLEEPTEDADAGSEEASDPGTDFGGGVSSADRSRTSRIRIALGPAADSGRSLVNASAAVAAAGSSRSLFAAAGAATAPNSSFAAAFAAAAAVRPSCVAAPASVGPRSFVVPAGPSSPQAMAGTPFSRYTMDGTPVDPSAGARDEWDDAVLTEPNEYTAVYGKALQGRYYSFKAHQTIAIHFDNVRRDGRLQQVGGAFESGRLNVVMGPSGCGKSTLIELLSGRLPTHDLDAFEVANQKPHEPPGGGGGTGRRLPPVSRRYQHQQKAQHHHSPQGKACGAGGGRDDGGGQRKQICLSRTSYRSMLGFVPQEDILHADLTVQENLAYSARLKLPRSVSRNDVDSIIDETLDMLDMEHLRHSRTGSVERKSLSGGQRKRVSIGVEIVGKRPVMFMDEPTSGLDATTSYELCVLLSQIAKTFQINIIAVIHQPSYRCFRLFDCLLLLGRRGELTFHGRPRDCVTHFRAQGYRVVLKDCAETILDIVYRHPLGMTSPEPSARGRIELVIKPAGAAALESAAAEGPQTADSVYSVSWSPDGSTLALGTGDGTLQLCDAASAECVAQLKGHSNCVRSVCWRPCGFGAAQLVSGGDDLSLRLWRHDASVSAELAAAAGGTATAAAAGGSCTATFEGHSRVVTCVTWSPDGRFMASAGSWDKTVRLWDPASSHSIATLEHRHAVSAVAWSPDGKRLASGSNGGAVWLWETERCKCTATLKGHTDWVRSVSWALNSRNLVSGSSDRTVRLWDAVTRECLAILEGHESYITSVAWRPGGNLVASGSGDRCVRLWDAATGTCMATLQGHTGAVTSVAWTSDGSSLASGSSDGTVRVWDPVSGSAKLSYAAKLHQAGGSAGASGCGLGGWLRRWARGTDSQTPRDVQLACLIHRNLVKSSRVSLGATLLDVLYLQIAALIVGCIQGSSWGPSKVPSNFVMAYLVLSMLAAVTHLRTFSVSRMVQLYERMSGVSVCATFLSSNITDLGWLFVSPAVYFSIYFFINSPQAGFSSFYVLGFLVCWWSSGLSYVISTSIMPHQHHTTVAVIGTLIMGAFLHGLSPSIASSRHSVVELVLGLSYSRWTMEAITIQELRSGDHYAWNEAVAVQSSIGVCGLDRVLSKLGGGSGDSVSEDEALGFLQLWRSYEYGYCEQYYSRAKTVLFCMGFGMRLVAWIQMKFLKLWIDEANALLLGLRKSFLRWRRARSCPCECCHSIGIGCCRTCSGAIQDDGADTAADASAAAADLSSACAPASAAAAAGFDARSCGFSGGGKGFGYSSGVGGSSGFSACGSGFGGSSGFGGVLGSSGFGAGVGEPLPTIASRGSGAIGQDAELASQPSRPPTLNLLSSGALAISVLATCNTV
ncbi:hypothetical protein PLESTM_000140200 [Pleodorina starrii]|nr:hypothetical protein PLESTM_000140200 [Pleodorina starrii]